MLVDDLFMEKPPTPDGYRDWRLPENRVEAITRVVHTRMVEGELDHHHSAKVIAGEMSLSKDDMVLYSLLFGQSYRNHWAMLALQLWPDLMREDPQNLIDWHNANWRRLMYGNDTKWGVRKWPHFVADLQKRYGKISLYEHFGNLANSGTTEQNFRAVNEELRQLYGIGRMTAWLAQQTLYEFFGWDIDHWDQQLYDSGTWSQYDSLCYLYDRLDIARSQKDPVTGKVSKYSPTKADIALMEGKTQELMEYMNRKIPFHVDIYNVESAECEYRKTAYGPKIKEYTFWTANELVEQYAKLRSLWQDYEGPNQPNWMPYIIGFMTKGKNVRDYGYDRSYFRVLCDHGFNLNTHFLYPEEPNAHEWLKLPKQTNQAIDMVYSDWETLSEDQRRDLQEKYNPIKYLRFKPRDHEAWTNTEADLSYAGEVNDPV